MNLWFYFHAGGTIIWNFRAHRQRKFALVFILLFSVIRKKSGQKVDWQWEEDSGILFS